GLLVMAAGWSSAKPSRTKSNPWRNQNEDVRPIEPAHLHPLLLDRGEGRGEESSSSDSTIQPSTHPLSTMLLLAQIPAPASGSIENWLLSAAAIASMAVLAKKLFLRKPAETEFVTKTEFHQEVSTLRD